MTKSQERESLAEQFERHAEEEGSILDRYRALADKLGDSAVGNLVSHILTEEEMHHLLLRTMATWLRGHHAASQRTLLPAADRAELLRLTQTLQQHERDTIEGCRSLKARLSGSDRELLECLLDAMALDSEKHHRLLATAERMLQA